VDYLSIDAMAKTELRVYYSQGTAKTSVSGTLVAVVRTTLSTAVPSVLII
tara:strand:- start:2975 stop:3124 length:150 start_codon:yes stop_codon:yes gene_type:complete